ncbi:chemotaxis protein [Shewanella sp. NIFS-20-20]|uniref:chemotaxis protein n=1 Tax=Shewanella sp. NIFS-20-20 TaxID=2853806 RepID=UPI001C4430BC|nr:chemotaxis protein [Shewanella sp. NIFS-20-20]MBV7316819.1 chemotaxis protein [Shewanella sp. NIFS-20-20]
MEHLGKGKRPYYVTAALVAAELNETLASCKEINLTASNAQAASSRIGSAALGFKALTHYIDELAGYTKKAANEINDLAKNASKIATNTAKTATAMHYFELAYAKAHDATYRDSMKKAIDKTAQHYHQQQSEFNKILAKMEVQLAELKQNLRSANALASICRVEACRVDTHFQAIFVDVANKVDVVAAQIRGRVDTAIRLFDSH